MSYQGLSKVSAGIPCVVTLLGYEDNDVLGPGVGTVFLFLGLGFPYIPL